MKLVVTVKAEERVRWGDGLCSPEKTGEVTALGVPGSLCPDTMPALSPTLPT